ncbi:MAG: phosphonate metabolism protein/1,5-bisphosphokinase (PRPP-forming) PhnN [Candidatus Lokiarchaeota archaeon]|nr:phosphonate metabolism protein/1,5-bisphosphokinase (PRPP-forming) PhnN [Candidatus Lokiarchaeota archaeon]
MVKQFLGTLFLIVGNSGSGKDSIISGVIEKYPPNLIQIIAPKRSITRPSSESEDNISVTSKEFRELEEKGKFALKWHIYKLDYGIPRDIEKWLKKGHPVIINVSRTIVEKARENYSNVKVIFVEVPFEITYQRIKDRKRESEELLKKRIERARKNQKFPEADFVVNNSGDLNQAITQCLNYLIQVIRLKNK